MADSDLEANLIQVEISNRIPNLWLDELYSVTLTASDPSIELPSRVVAFQAVYLSVTSGSVTMDRILWPLSTFEYSAQPNKEQEGPPTSYWLRTVVPPEVYFWPVPDDAATYVFKARLLRQVQDANLASGYTVDMPYRWLDVYVAGLAYRLARIYAPDKEQLREKDYEKAWAIAATTDKEQVPTYLNVASGIYYR